MRLRASMTTVEGWRQGRHWWGRLFLGLILLILALGPQASAWVPEASAQGGSYSVTLNVISIGAPPYSTAGTIDGFAYLVNEDNSGDPTDDPADCDPNTPGYPANCDWPSIKPMASHSPVVETGTVAAGNQVTLNLPAGRYLVTVRAEGHKLGGKHIRLPDDAGQTLDVELVNDPLPLSTIRVHVFHDNHPVNGENDIPVESGLEGFRVVIEDGTGEVTVDWWGNPICTRYDGNPNGSTPLGDPLPIGPSNPGYCITDANGDLVIDNIPRGKYEVLAIPPDGSGWIQTTTIEGTHIIDAWVVEGDQGYSPREGFQTAAVWIGFVKEMDWGEKKAPGTGTIRGTVKTTIEFIPPVNPLVLGDPVDRPYIALTDIGGNDEQVYLGRGNPDGTFEINNVPDGVYQLAIWDEPLDYIISFRTAVVDSTVNGGVVDLGEFGIPRWFSWLSGEVFLDADRDGIRDTGETTLPNVELLMRFRDASIRYSTFTDGNGFYEFPEVFELEKFYVTEVGFTHHGFTSALVHDEFLDYNPNDPNTYRVIDGVLTASNLNWAGKRSTVDWGKYIYQTGENGGISGIVQYATTRNEFDARLQATEDYEPGVPGVTVRLWEMVKDGFGNPVFNPDGSVQTGALLNEVETDQFEHPSAANGNPCDVTDSTGAPLPDPLGLGDNCIEVPNISNEVQEGVFDGGYAFETIFPNGYPNGPEIPIPEGDYVVEVVPPPGYKIVTEEDLNTAEGSTLVPAVPPSGCMGEKLLMNVPDEYGSPFDAFLDDGTPIPGVDPQPLCNMKAATVQQGRNTGVDFYLMTDNGVPIPGRVFGFLLDDLNIETDPNRIYYGEKRGIPNTPVGIRDFTGRLITTVHSDENGIWEVLLPSTYVADCPIPGGVCPAVYKFVGNDPGDPDNPNPNYNPNYQTITFQFEVWPGKTTFADVALFPITAFNAFPGGQFNQPANCSLPDDTPQIFSVNPPYGSGGDTIVISGRGFGTTPGTVHDENGIPLPSIFVTSWTDTEIQIVVPGLAPNGPGQLLVTAANGKTSPTGITFHKIGGAYTPTILTVDDDGPADYTTIQAAIDAASGDTLVVVKPGTYYDAVTLNKAGVKLQGYGPGADDGFGTGGSVIDQRFILTAVGVNVVGTPGMFSADFNPLIDGFRITSARDEQDVGGGIHVDQYGQFLEISNNVIQSNGGNFGGGITLGEPYRGDNHNDDIRIHHNRILNNGGFSLAGGLGIFNGADNYEIDHNDICGNYSGEYGGGISHFGLSLGGQIHHNRLFYNNAFDEGGAILIGGELPRPPEPGQPLPPDALTDGSGPVDIYNNLIQGNMSNDDGGGVRLLQPLDYRINIVNNIIVNNVSTDFGGGVALDDASNVTLVNNTIARNSNTSTAEDSDGLPHAAGVAVETYSANFAAYLAGKYGSSAPDYVDPTMFNNIICENEAYTWDGASLLFDSFFDLEVFAGGPSDVLHPTYSLLTDPTGTDPSNSACGDLNALFQDPFTNTLDAVAFRMEPDFITVVMVTVNLPPELLGDYHILDPSPAVDAGTDIDPIGGEVYAPCDDFDDEERWTGAAHDIGADELSGTPSGTCVGAAPALGVALVPPSLSAQTVPDSQVVFYHGVVNIGEVADAYDLVASVDTGWVVTVAPAQTPTLNPLGTAVMSATVTIPPGVISGTVATVHITATSQTDPAVFSTALDTITVLTTPVVAVPPANFYLSLERNTGGAGIGDNSLVARDEDIIGWVDDGTPQGSYVMVFDGSDVGVGGVDIDAFDILADGTILMSFRAATNIDVNGDLLPDPVDDSDIVAFHPAAPDGLGPNTAGTFSMFLSGADVGLTTNGEDVDGIMLLAPDELVISTVGNVRVRSDTADPGSPTVRGRDEDLLLYRMQDAQNPGAAGFWSLIFDGSDVGLQTNNGGEDVDGVYMDPENQAVYLTTTGNFSVTGLSGADEDVFICQGASTTPEAGGTRGSNTATTCTSFASFFVGGNHGITNTRGRDIDAIDLP